MSEGENKANSEPLKWERRDQVAILTLSRPHALNSFDLELMQESWEFLHRSQAGFEEFFFHFFGGKQDHHSSRNFYGGTDIQRIISGFSPLVECSL